MILTDHWTPDFDDPDDLLPEERLDRVVRLLALGAVRLAQERKVLKTRLDYPK
ncbi:MAG: hypothetical protein HZC17_01775 [Candidatus Omnitrophica bacterium]|nr:hypothetical protein [Candidatus Omnitrophota bacterium]